MTNAALYYHPDGYRTDGKKLMGRQAAGESFLKGFLHYAEVDELVAVCTRNAHAEDFKAFRREVLGDADTRPAKAISKNNLKDLEAVGTVFCPGPGLEDYVWRRRRAKSNSFSVTGITHTTASELAMSAIAGLLTAPVEPWDALICTSNAVRNSVDRLHEIYGSYLAERYGVKHVPCRAQLPVIPLGIFADDFDLPDDQRLGHRTRLRQKMGIAEQDIVVLFVGRLSFHAKANPAPMLIALEQTVKSLAPGVRLHLIQSGWFANDAIERAFREANKTFAPSVVHHLVNGRDPDYRANAWHASDIFCSLSDNIQETFGLTPVEAMAAQLPLVVTDWNGYRDTIPHGEAGFRIATVLPDREAGLAFADRYEDGTISYDRYCAESSMATAVDIRQTTEAFTTLANDPDKRKAMGQAGRKRVRDHYDWRVVVRQYQELWTELAARRAKSEAPDSKPTKPDPEHMELWGHPTRPNPFHMFAGYPTHQLSPKTRLHTGHMDTNVLRNASKSIILSVDNSPYVGPSQLGQNIFNQVRHAGDAGVTLEEIYAANADKDRAMATTTTGWLLKIGALRVEEAALTVPEGSTGP
ncbi:MAG: glycosyltransferase family 4 protein [Alphaproteobacteria bacterium]|nr:glycosyltransferase family 4 protein [Alphaproteobacteria bacterium SS10]